MENQQKILEAQREIYKKIIDGSDLSEVKISDYSDELKPHIQAILDSDIGYRNSLANYENEKSAAEINKKIAEAYPYNRYGTVKGTVKYISPSSFSNEHLGSVYIVKLELDNSNENINVISGLSGVVEIKIGKRTIMNYFLEPIIKGFGESLKEM